MYATLGAAASAELSAHASNLDALLMEVSLTAGRGTITVCDHDDGDIAEWWARRRLGVRAWPDATQEKVKSRPAPCRRTAVDDD